MVSTPWSHELELQAIRDKSGISHNFELTDATFSADISRECSFVEGPDAGCDGVCFSEATLDECGLCDGGNECANLGCEVGESELVTLPFIGTGNNTGLVNDFTSPQDWADGPGGDYAYGFELTETTNVSIGMCGTYYNHGHDAFLELYDATDCDNINMVAYNDDGYGWYYYDYDYSSCDGLDSFIQVTLEPGFYYAVAGGYADDEGGYEISIESNDEVTTPWSHELELQAIRDKSGISHNFELTDATFSADISRECSFVEGPDAGCDGVCFSEATLDECGECAGDNSTCTDECGVINGDNSTCSDCAGTPNGEAELDECGVCAGDNSTCTDECGVINGDNSTCADCAGIPNGEAELDECGVCDGNSSSYDSFDVINIVNAVALILDDVWSSDNLYCSDVNDDGVLDIVDIILMVEAILGSSRIVDASEVTLSKENNSLTYNADGFVGGLQITLSHGDNFDINLTANAMVADYKTSGSFTTIIIAAPEQGQLFATSSDFIVEEVIAGTSAGEILVTMPVDFGLSAAYPNPFNPSTSFNLNMSSTEMVSIDVYNVMGQRVDTIHNGELTAGVHSFSWNGAEIASGAYLIRATTASNVATQKVMLMK